MAEDRRPGTLDEALARYADEHAARDDLEARVAQLQADLEAAKSFEQRMIAAEAGRIDLDARLAAAEQANHAAEDLAAIAGGFIIIRQEDARAIDRARHLLAEAKSVREVVAKRRG